LNAMNLPGLPYMNQSYFFSNACARKAVTPEMRAYEAEEKAKAAAAANNATAQPRFLRQRSPATTANAEAEVESQAVVENYVRHHGSTLDLLSSYLNCYNFNAKTMLASDVSLEKFRQDLKDTMASPPTGESHRRFMVVDFKRSNLDLMGYAHFSPVAAYNAEEDKALVFDVARNKYPPYWVPVETLHTAMNTVDSHTNTTRGYVLINGLANADTQAHLEEKTLKTFFLEEMGSVSNPSNVLDMQGIDTNKAQMDLNRAWGKIQEASKALSSSKNSLNAHHDPETFDADLESTDSTAAENFDSVDTDTDLGGANDLNLKDLDLDGSSTSVDDLLSGI